MQRICFLLIALAATQSYASYLNLPPWDSDVVALTKSYRDCAGYPGCDVLDKIALDTYSLVWAWGSSWFDGSTCCYLDVCDGVITFTKTYDDGCTPTATKTVSVTADDYSINTTCGTESYVPIICSNGVLVLSMCDNGDGCCGNPVYTVWHAKKRWEDTCTRSTLNICKGLLCSWGFCNTYSYSGDTCSS